MRQTLGYQHRPSIGRGEFFSVPLQERRRTCTNIDGHVPYRTL